MKNKALLAFRIFALLLSLVGLTYRLIAVPIMEKNWILALDMLGYFTIQTNLFVFIIFLSLLINQLKGTPDKAFSPQVRGAGLLYIIVTSLIFMVLLSSSMHDTALGHVVFSIMDLGMAILLLIDNLMTIEPCSYRWSLIPKWMIYPVTYLAFLIVEGLAFSRFRYYILDYRELGLSNYLFFLLLLLSIFILLSVMIIFVNRIYRNKAVSQ